MHNLKSAYNFLVEYFTEDDCIFNQEIEYKNRDLFKYCHFKHTEKFGRTMFITNSKMFEVFYLRWIKKTNQMKNIKRDTFVKDLVELGVVGRYVVKPNTPKKTAIRISRKILETKLAEHYKLKTFVIEDLVFESSQWSDLEANMWPKRWAGC